MHATIVEGSLVSILAWPFSLVSPYIHSLFLIWCVRLLLFRVMLGSGAIKYTTRDASWRNLTAMNYHYFTQPLPNPLSYFFFFYIPPWGHKLSVVTTHVIEDYFAWFIFAPSSYVRFFFLLCTINLMLVINFAGNYGFLALITIVKSVALLDDSILLSFTPQLSCFIPGPYSDYPVFSLPFILTAIVAIFFFIYYLLLGSIPLLGTFPDPFTYPFYPEIVQRFPFLPRIHCPEFLAYIGSKIQEYYYVVYPYVYKTYYYLRPFRGINRYAKFGSMTKRRWEIIIQGSSSPSSSKSVDSVWTEWNFKFKPGDPNKAPKFVYPFGHLPGLDWQAWFLPLRYERGDKTMPKWFERFIWGLLDNKQDIVNLMETQFKHINPQPTLPLRKLRVLLYDYKFQFGKWWVREFIEQWGPDFEIDDAGNHLDRVIIKSRGF